MSFKSTSGTDFWDTYLPINGVNGREEFCGGKCFVMVYGAVAQLVSLCEFTVSTRHKSQVQAQKSIRGVLLLFYKFADVLPTTEFP